MTKILTDAKVGFCSIMKPEGHKNGKHLLGVVVSKKFKKELEDDFNALWEENKTAKAKKPTYDFADWFSEDEKTGELLFWTTAKANAERGIKLKREAGTNFVMADFGAIGAGSIIDLSYDLYYFNSKEYGEMISRSIKAISLKSLVRYEDDGGLDGESMDDFENHDVAPTKNVDEDIDDDEEVEAPKKEKKDKKKKKKNKDSEEE